MDRCDNGEGNNNHPYATCLGRCRPRVNAVIKLFSAMTPATDVRPLTQAGDKISLPGIKTIKKGC